MSVIYLYKIEPINGTELIKRSGRGKVEKFEMTFSFMVVAVK